MTPVKMDGDGMNIDSLQKQYCPPLDEALFFALASDYDTSRESDLAELRIALDSLKDNAVLEQELELLPEPKTSKDERPGVSVDNKQTKDHSGASASLQNSHSSQQSTTEDDGVTSITTGISGLAPSEGYGEAVEALESLSTEKKIEWLQNMFPSVSKDSVVEVLARCENRFDTTTDELLNIAFLNETEQEGQALNPIVKGIDAFILDDDAARQKRKTRNKRKQNRLDYDGTSSPWMSDSAISSGAETPASSSSNAWSAASHDVDFIASRTYLKPKLISSVYHANGTLIAPTIRALAMKEGQSRRRAADIDEELMKWQVEELKYDFEQVPDSIIYGVLILANKIPPAAKELLEVMVTSKEEPVVLGKVKGLASYAPIDLSEDEDSGKSVSAPWPVTALNSAGPYTTSHMANSHGVAAAQAYQQASAAYRRGKSDHLMGGAAAYYASVGHERNQAAKVLQASAADMHVAKQSSSTALDLHGVNVADAVRIARQRSEAWWEGLGDRKYVVGGIGSGFRIVTGVGRHSSDGIGRIGPAVSKMLLREGWKVQVNTGELVVLGKARKR